MRTNQLLNNDNNRRSWTSRTPS